METLRGEIKELLGASIYSGETQENFILGAICVGKKVLYDKTKLPPRARPELYAEKGSMQFPVQRALVKSKELGHSPLVIEGRLSKFSPFMRNKKQASIEFPMGFLLPVTSLWIPRDDIAWREYDPFDKRIPIYQLLQQVSPLDFLENHARRVISETDHTS